ncbi:MAG: di-trans,poly-cis-decaprenylcistransferase [Pelagibacteraceae bacterium]|nr:di-trans,poly-cis-decaprenylcistransferase [Pelagibacteraceae bacterium]
MDGNNRWSKKNKIAQKKAYKKGIKNLIKLSEYSFFELNISYVSAFALSTHNMQRSKTILKIIIDLLEGYLDEFILNHNKYKFNLNFIGDFEIFNKSIKNKIDILNKNSKYDKNLIIALNYSGQKDIITASKKFYKTKTKKEYFEFLSTSSFPNPDILIRTGGFQRLSDFFLFQTSFTDFFFTKTLWPDFSKKLLKNIIIKSNNLERKFGK